MEKRRHRTERASALRRLAVWPARLGLALGSAALPLLAFEAWVRSTRDEPAYPSRSNFVFDRDLGFRQQPGLRGAHRDEFGTYPFELSSLGFRGPELPPPDGEKPEGLTRIAFFGDSFLQGYVVRPERLMTTVTERLVEEAGREAEVYALGSSDFGTAQELLLLRAYGEQIRPDAVVLQLYVGNDVLNNGLELARMEGAKSDYFRPYLVPDDDGGLALTYTHPFRAWLRHRSRAFRIYELQVLGWGEARGIESLTIARPRVPPKDRVAQGRTPTHFHEVLREHPPESPWEDAWETTAALLGGFRDESRRLGARLLVLIVPMQEQALYDAEHLCEDIRSRAMGGPPLGELVDWNHPERRLEAICAELGIEARFLLDPLRRAAVPGEPLYALDKHLSWRGHTLAGEVVADWFLAEPEPFTPTRLETREPAWIFPRDPSEAPRGVDFRESDGDDFLYDGWDPFRSEASWIGADSSGRFTRTYSSLVLPSVPGDLVLRGCVPSVATLPQRVELLFFGHHTYHVELARSGPFELRVPDAIPRHVLESEVDPYVRLLIRTDPTFDQGTRRKLGLFLQEVRLVE